MTYQGYISSEGPHSLAGGPRIVDLRHLSARDLEPILLEETAEWRSELDWDFSKSADVVRKFIDAKGLSGVALLDRGEVSGYGYTGLEGDKGSIWDVYVRRGWRDGNNEGLLLRLLIDALIGNSGVHRIESQLMLTEAASAEALQRMRLFERFLMQLNAGAPLPPGRASTALRFRLEPWGDHHYDAAGIVISRAYAGHVDSQINDHYRTFTGARRFVYNLVQFPGCATFYRPASYVAYDPTTGQVAGMSLCNFIAGDVAHIAELCVTPQFQGAGLGYQMLSRSIAALLEAGAKRISVTVTAANEGAVRLYRRRGFRNARRFYAYVWERD